MWLYRVLGMDRRTVGLATGKIRKPDRHNTESGQDMASGVSSYERVSLIETVLHRRLQNCVKISFTQKCRSLCTRATVDTVKKSVKNDKVLLLGWITVSKNSDLRKTVMFLNYTLIGLKTKAVEALFFNVSVVNALITHHYIANIVGGLPREWLEWWLTNSWLCRRIATVVIKRQQNNFTYLNVIKSNNCSLIKYSCFTKFCKFTYVRYFFNVR